MEKAPKKVAAINFDTGEMGMEKPDLSQVGNCVMNKHKKWSDYRRHKEESWLEQWAMYLGTPEALEYTRNEVGHIVGSVNDDWRHRLNTGKAYEVVETANAYLQAAFFPNRDYLLVKPELPGYREKARRTTAWMKEKLRQANINTYWEMFIRQQLITGFSCISLPWMKRYEKRRKREKVTKVVDEMMGSQVTVWEAREFEKLTYNNTQLEVLSCFDVFVDPYAKDLQNASIIRVLHKNMADIVKGYHDGIYDSLNIAELLQAGKKKDPGANTNKQTTANFLGLNFDPNEQVQCYEFWGSIEVGNLWLENVVVTMVNGKVARIKDIPYWAGKPFIVGVAVPVPNHVYGLGILEPVLGMIHENNILTNQRLDTLEIMIDGTYVMVDDGVTDPDSVYTAPGHVIETADVNNIQPLAKDMSFQVSYQEQDFLEQKIDQSTGIGAYVSASAGRNAERVTATEVAAVREAGGTRLASIHRHMEQTQFLPFLEKWLYLAQQFVVEDDVVALSGESAGETNYYAVGAEELNEDYKLHVVGADFLAERDKVITDLLTYIETVAQIPEWRELIDWESLLEVFTIKFNLAEDVEQLIRRGVAAKLQAAQEEAQNQAPASPADQMAALAEETGGAGGLREYQGREALMGQNSAMAELAAKLSMAPTDQVAASTAAASTQDTQPPVS